MTHFLDTLPLDFSRPPTQELEGFLADTYFREADVLRLVRNTGIPPGLVAWGQPSRDLWRDLLIVARNREELRPLLQSIVDGDNAAISSRIAEFLDSEPVIEAPPSAQTPAEQDPANTSLDGSDNLERQLSAEPTLLDVSFMERGLEIAPAVARLLVTRGGKRYYGTAFRIGANQMLTNHHVLYPNGAVADAVEMWFFYEQNFAGVVRAHTVVPGDPTTIAGAADHDWAVVQATTGLPEGIPVVSLTEAEAEAIKVNDRVYIIQHPNGGVKKIGMIHNVVRYSDSDVIGYRTDTEPGSSGSPVFDERWRLVALHHRWARRAVGGRSEVMNQGRRIARVRAGLVAAGIVFG